MKCGFLKKCMQAFSAVFFASVLTVPGLAGPERENGCWYYRDEAGSRVSNSFVSIDGNTYYFGGDGTLVKNCPVENADIRYFCDGNGRILKGQWKKCMYPGETAESWYYYLESGKAFENGWILIGGKKYHFTDRHMDFGWYTEEVGAGKTAVYYLGTENAGNAAVGWLAWKGDDSETGQEHPAGWYYFRENGRMVCDTELKIGEETYAFNGDGTMAAGFCRVAGENGTVKEKYYERRTGCRAAGWLWLAGENEKEDGWYYFTEGELLVPGNCTKKLSDDFGVSLIDGSWYGFDGSGRMLEGIVSVGGRDYCFGEDGKMRTGLILVRDEETGTEEELLFLSSGSAPPSYGAAAEGVVDGCLYQTGHKICAKDDNYEQIEVETENETYNYVVDTGGRVIRSGTVTLKNGQKMKIIRHKNGWKLVSLLDGE